MIILKPCLPKLACQTLHILGTIVKAVTMRQQVKVLNCEVSYMLDYHLSSSDYVKRAKKGIGCFEKWGKDQTQSIQMILGSIQLIVVMCRSQRPNSSLRQIWSIGLAPWCFPMTAIHCKKLCFSQSELDQFNMENMYKTISKIKASIGINLGGNAVAIQWQCKECNNSNV